MKKCQRKHSLQTAIDLTIKDLVKFRSGFLMTGENEVRSPQFHHDWSRILLEEKGNFAVEAFRESGKSQIVVRSFLLHSLFYPSKDRDYIVIVKATAKQATDKLKEIQREFLAHPILSANIKKIYDSSGDTFTADILNPAGKVVQVRIDAFGKGASLRGLSTYDRRPKVIIVDDPQDKEDSRSETVLASDWEWFLSDLLFLGQSGSGRIFLIGNNLGAGCIIERVFEQAEHLKFKTIKIPALQNGVSAWEDKFTTQYLEQEREDFRKLGKLDVWMRERQCEALADESRVFHREDFRYYGHKTVDDRKKGANIYILIDPASSVDKESCYRAMAVVAVDIDNNWFILDFPYGRWDSAQFTEMLFEKVKQWRPKVVGIEKGMYKQVWEPFLLKEMPRRNIFFDIKGIEHAKQGSKLERIKMLGPRFKSHSIWFPDEAPWLAELESELLGVKREGFTSLYVDLIDALSMTFQIAEIPINSSNRHIDSLPRQSSLITEI